MGRCKFFPLFSLGILPIVGVLIFSALASAKSDEISVFAAASLADALKEISKLHERETGTQVALNLAASNILERQIEEGAPADLFFSADEEKMDLLSKKALIVAGSRKSLLSNRLVIIGQKESPFELHQIQDLNTPQFSRIALADPQGVPAGIYAKSYLESKGLWSALLPHIIPTENVRAAMAAVESGNADAAIVYLSDAKSSTKTRILYDIPAADSPRISYPVAILRESAHLDSAKKFMETLQSPTAQEIFIKHGFIVLP